MPLHDPALPAVQPIGRGRSATVVTLNGRPVTVEWSRAATRAFAERERPLVVELELLFSCLVKKSVHFHDTAPPCEAVMVTDRLLLCFRAVTASACTMELAERLGRQPVTAIDTPRARRLAPRRVWLDHLQGSWHAEFWL